jgi:hypothetical protein
MIKFTVGGMASAFFFMLLVLLGQKVWLSIKGNQMSGASK